MSPTLNTACALTVLTIIEFDNEALTVAPEVTVTTALETNTVSPSKKVLLKLLADKNSVLADL